MELSEYQFKKALHEATKWEHQLTKNERSDIAIFEARRIVVNRIFDKYKNKIIKK